MGTRDVRSWVAPDDGLERIRPAGGHDGFRRAPESARLGMTREFPPDSGDMSSKGWQQVALSGGSEGPHSCLPLTAT